MQKIHWKEALHMSTVVTTAIIHCIISFIRLYSIFQSKKKKEHELLLGQKKCINAPLIITSVIDKEEMLIKYFSFELDFENIVLSSRKQLQEYIEIYGFHFG